MKAQKCGDHISKVGQHYGKEKKIYKKIKNKKKSGVQLVGCGGDHHLTYLCHVMEVGVGPVHLMGPKVA